MTQPGPLLPADSIAYPALLALMSQDGSRLFSTKSAGSVLTDQPDAAGNQSLSMQKWQDGRTDLVQRWRMNDKNTHLHRNDSRYTGPDNDGELKILCPEGGCDSGSTFASYNDPNIISKPYLPGTINGQRTYICGGPSGAPFWPDYGGQDPGEECRWITDNQVLRCCTKKDHDSREQKICSDGYDPNNPNGFCKEYMSDWCVSNWGQTNSIPDNAFDLQENNNFCSPYIEDIKNKGAGTVGQTVSNYYNNSGFDPSNPFWTTYVPELCSAYPGACNDTLSKICAEYTPRDIVEAEVIQKLCGCFLPDKYYPVPKLQSGVKVSRACTPMCVFPDAIQQDGKGCSDADICIIDDVTIDLIKSKGKNITFDTVCGKSSNPNRFCYFANIDINEDRSSLDSINYENNCKVCYTFDPSKPDVLPTLIDCKTGKSPGPAPGPGPNPGPKPTPRSKGIPLSEWLMIGGGSLVMLVITVIICVLVWWFIYRKGDSTVKVSKSGPSLSSPTTINM